MSAWPGHWRKTSEHACLSGPSPAAIRLSHSSSLPVAPSFFARPSELETGPPGLLLGLPRLELGSQSFLLGAPSPELGRAGFSPGTPESGARPFRLFFARRSKPAARLSRLFARCPEPGARCCHSRYADLSGSLPSLAAGVQLAHGGRLRRRQIPASAPKGASQWSPHSGSSAFLPFSWVHLSSSAWCKCSKATICLTP